MIWRLGRDFEIVTNVRRADVTKDSGWALVELIGDEGELERGLEWVRSRGVGVEPAEGDLVDK